MELADDPTQITDEGQYWLRAQRVTGYPRIARDTYFPRHDVKRPADVTEDDLPHIDEEATKEAVAEIDREALDETYTSGKWQVRVSEEEVAELWAGILEDVSEEVVWDAKVTTAFGLEELPYEEYVVVIYTPNYFERHDVDRVREHLRDAHGVTDEIPYKPDVYTSKGIVDENAEEWGLDGVGGYRA